jgi:hypothetical protein
MEPVFAHLLAEKWNKEDQEAGSKPTALNTLLRYSSAHGCARQWAYAALAQPTEAWDVASTWVTRLGTLIHEVAQEAIVERYPDFKAEVPSKVNEYISGSADGLARIDDYRAIVEIKTVGNYVWQQQTGFGQFKKTDPKGPKPAAIVQAGMNAIGIENTYTPLEYVDYLCLITMAKEAVSIGKAAKMGIENPYDRFVAEWWFPRMEWEDPTLEEIDRMTLAGEQIEAGELPAPEVVNDDYQRVSIRAASDCWQCDYCSFRTLCEQDGNITNIADSAMTTKEQS